MVFRFIQLPKLFKNYHLLNNIQIIFIINKQKKNAQVERFFLYPNSDYSSSAT